MSPKEELVKEWLRLAEFEITKIKAEKAVETATGIKDSGEVEKKAGLWKDRGVLPVEVKK